MRICGGFVPFCLYPTLISSPHTFPHSLFATLFKGPQQRERITPTSLPNQWIRSLVIRTCIVSIRFSPTVRCLREINMFQLQTRLRFHGKGAKIQDASIKRGHSATKLHHRSITIHRCINRVWGYISIVPISQHALTILLSLVLS